MNKLEFISRQLAKASSKKYEHYVITRIWHLLNDLDIKFVTQQYVVRPEGRALTDMYFPQLFIHIEIDELHHKNQVDADILREVDIINATGHELIRVDVTQELESLNKIIDSIVTKIKEAKASISEFKRWDIEAEQNPRTYISRGTINLNDDVAFRTMVDAANCFGRIYKEKGIWKGGVFHPKEAGKLIWFPKLYPNKQWINSISNDEDYIYEKNSIEKEARNHIDGTKASPHNRIVFARVRSNLGDIMYRFKGEYELDFEKTNYENGLVWRRISESVKTYSSN